MLAFPPSDAAPAALPSQMLDSLPDGVLLLRGDGRVLHANPAAALLLHRDRAQLLAQGLAGLKFVDSSGAALPHGLLAGQLVVDGAEAIDQELGLLYARDAQPDWLRLRARAQLVEGERCVLLTVSSAQQAHGPGFQDVVSRDVAFQDVVFQDVIFQDVVDHCADIVLITDAGQHGGEPRIVYANAAFTRLTGYPLHEVLGRNPRFLQGPETSAEALRAIREALALHQPVRQVLRNYTRSGQPFWLDLHIFPLRGPDGVVHHFAAVERDVTATQDVVQRLLHDTHHDPLTGALNRRGFDEQARATLAQGSAAAEPVALLLLDIDHFKHINDTHGHETGDRVLKAVAATLRARLRGHDLVARFGGEEFVCLLPETSFANALAVAEALRRSVAQRGFGALPAGEVTISVGVAAGEPPIDLDALASQADAAMYAAKQNGRNRVCVAATCAQPAVLA